MNIYRRSSGICVAALGVIMACLGLVLDAAPAADLSASSDTGKSGSLPDNRGYELVSPIDKNGGDAVTLVILGVPVPTQAAVNGNAVTYGSVASFGGSPSSELASQYLSARGADGWSTRAISPPNELASEPIFAMPYESFSDDLSEAVVDWRSAALTPEARIGYNNLYLRNNDGLYRLIATSVREGSTLRFAGASSDYSHIVFEAKDALTSNAVANSGNVYEWSDGQLSLVSVAPGGNAGVPEARAGGGENAQNAVSSDGRMVFWTDGEGQLYVSRNGTESVKVNASKRSPSVGDGRAVFEGATPNGELVFFTDATALTTSPKDNGGLYEFDTSTGELTDLTPDEAGSPGLLGMVGFGDDGSYVYYVADASLETLPKIGNAGAAAGQPNLYVSHGGQVSFIATLSSDDSSDWAQKWTERQASVTPDGLHMVLVSDARLMGYDNSDAGTGKPDTEVFLYDAGGSQLHCLSCNRSGELPIGPASIPAWSGALHNPHYLSKDGNRLFFDSSDALTLRDTNRRQDVYEWERDGSGG
jgi:hypothetical protein